MPSGSLVELIATASTRHFNGTGYRAIDTRYHAIPLSVEGSRRKSGRFHTVREVDAIYPALDPATSLYETGMLLRSDDRITAVPSNPRTVFTIAVDLPRVLDLRDPVTRTHLGFDLEKLKAPWRRATPNAPTQQLGLAAFRGGIQGIAYPSVHNPTGANLVVFPSNLTVGDTGSLRVFDSTGNFAHDLP